MKKPDQLSICLELTDNTVPMSGAVMQFLRTKILGFNKSQMADAVGAYRSAITRWERKERNELIASNAVRYIVHKLAGPELESKVQSAILVTK